MWIGGDQTPAFRHPAKFFFPAKMSAKHNQEKSQSLDLLFSLVKSHRTHVASGGRVKNVLLLYIFIVFLENL